MPLAHSVLDGDSADAGERGYGVDRQGADAGFLTLARDDGEGGILALREIRGDLGRNGRSTS